MITNELLRTLVYLWGTIAVNGEAAIDTGIEDTLLYAAKGLCEINGFFYKDKAALSEEERLAVKITEQMKELLDIRMGRWKEMLIGDGQ